MKSIRGFVFILASPMLSAVPLPARVASEYGRIPAYFEQNSGQTAPDTLFTSRGAAFSLALKRDGATLSFAGAQVSLELVKANQGTTVSAEEPLGGRSNYYLGNNPKKWITGVPHFGQVRYRNVYPGIDLLWHSCQQQLEYDLILGPGSDPRKIRLLFHGADAITIAGNGDLLLGVGANKLRQLLPAVWQQRGSERVRIGARYVLLTGGEVGVRLATYDPSRVLTIDPVLSYSTLLSGSQVFTNVLAIAVDSHGSAYLAGTSETDDFPGTTTGTGAYFVARLNAAGTGIIYATYFSGTSDINADSTYSYISGIAVDDSGNAYATGTTYATDFPVTPGTLQSIKSSPSDQDGFVLKFGAAGQILWGTYLGGSGNDGANAIAVDASGNSYVAGFSDSTDFPVTSGACAGDQDAFVTTLNAAGSALLNSVCLGGSGADTASAIALDSKSNVYITGTTQSPNLPTTPGAFQSSPKSLFPPHVFVAKFASGSLAYLTYLGGTGQDWVTSITVDSSGNAYVAGSTYSTDFPVTAGAFDQTNQSEADTGYIAKLNPEGTDLIWSTFLGGSLYDQIWGVAVDGPGNVYVSGTAFSADFPTTPGAFFCPPDYWQSTAFLSQLSADGSTLMYSGRLGSTGLEYEFGLVRGAGGALYIAGTTWNGNYPTTPGAYQTVPLAQGVPVGFVTKIDMTSPSLCNVVLSAAGTEIPGHGDTGSFDVTVPAGCPWEAISDNLVPISFGQIAHATTSATVSFTVGVNNSTTSGRTGHIQIGSETYTITQGAGSCVDPGFTPASLTFAAAGGLQNLNVALPSSCPLVASTSERWLQITSGGNTTGSGDLGIFVTSNNYAQRSGTVTIAGKTINVIQEPGPCAQVIRFPGPLPNSGASGTAPAVRCHHDVWPAPGQPASTF